MGEAGVGGKKFIQRCTGFCLHITFHLTEAFLHIDQILFRGQHFLVNGKVPGQILMLGEIAHRLSFGEDDLSLIGPHFADDDF